MTNHIPFPEETYVEHYGKKKKAFRIKSWKEKYKKKNKKEKGNEKD